MTRKSGERNTMEQIRTGYRKSAAGDVYRNGGMRTAGMRTALHQSKKEYNNTYEYGSAAPALDIPEKAPEKRKNDNAERRNHRIPGNNTGRKTAARPAHQTHINVLGMVVVLAAFAFLGIVMVHYVQLQSELTSTEKSVAGKQVTLTNLESSNDELYSRIISSVDLGEIEDTARNDLGMGYATEGQIVTYTSAGNDYMRKVDSGN